MVLPAPLFGKALLQFYGDITFIIKSTRICLLRLAVKGNLLQKYAQRGHIVYVSILGAVKEQFRNHIYIYTYKDLWVSSENNIEI
jgi:hypothetical protein